MRELFERNEIFFRREKRAFKPEATYLQSISVGAV